MESTPSQWLPPSPPPSQHAAATAESATPAARPSAGRAPHDRRPPSGLRRLFGPLLVAGLLLLKFGAKFKALLLLLPKLKLFTTSASMLLSVGAYALIWGLPFAAGFVALLFLHEMGHYIQLRREGVKPS